VPAVVALLRPTKLKLAFLAEWVLFVLILAAQGKLAANRQILIAVHPSILLYLAACALAAWSQHAQQLAQGWRLLGLALGLAMLDQVSKLIVTAFVPYQTSIPIVDGWMNLAHEHNAQGSWLASVFDVQSVGIFHTMQWLLALALVLLSVLCHRYYTTNNRQSLWADVAFLGISAGLASWICDMAFRGYIVDFIRFPGLVTFDLKDILVTLSVGAILAEVVDNPKVTWRWQGWRKEGGDLIGLGSDLLRFSIQELRRGKQ
jgi:lipoprotein signal peptidase